MKLMRALKHFPLVVFAAMTGAPAQEPLTMLPNQYTRVFENSAVDVIRVRYAPHEKLPVHDHSRYPTVYVYLSDSGPVRFTHIEEHAFSLVRRPLAMGTFRVSPGRLERHEVENLGDIPSEFLRVELKQLPLHTLDEHRSKPSFDLTRSSDTAEYSSPVLSISRIVVADAAARTMDSAHPTLLVAFAPADLVVGNSAVTLKRGDVYWVDADRSVRIQKAAVEAAHLLAIRLRE